MGMLFIAALLFRVRLTVAVGYGLGSAPGQDPGPRALHHWGHGCNKHRDPKNTVSPKEHNHSSAAHALCLKSDSVSNNFHLFHYLQDGCYLLSHEPIKNLTPSCKVERHLMLPPVKHSAVFHWAEFITGLLHENIFTLSFRSTTPIITQQLSDS